ncbi:MAG TPA: magnesium chelatase, partial [Fervidobacterium nodosum]|nr:magnesium chelatase [Fervidobacterium nodosum]
GEKSKDIRERVIKAREIQKRRYKDERIKLNAKMTHKMIEKYVRLSDDAESLLKAYAQKYKLSGRAIDKILKVSQTIADLNGKELIDIQCISEALQYRLNDNITEFII